ncbi:MAG: FHA domain-containing protein, partial [Chloroflexota bacterium]|nr:FHA domain-containing protein [Chloroflexota bacterium]
PLMAERQGEAKAKLVWLEPYSGAMREFLLHEGMSATIGRSASNDIHIGESHISRMHAVLTCRDGEFIIDDLDSANGTYVNGVRVEGSSTLEIGDEIHLFVSMLKLLDPRATPAKDALELVSMVANDRASLRIVKGPQRGQVYALLKEEIYIGRSTPNANWEITLQDPTVSRPHAFLVKDKHCWKLFDLGSANGTSVNRRPVIGGKARELRDGDRVMFGATMTLFRLGYPPPARRKNANNKGKA